MRVLIADDHDLVRDGLKPILGKLASDVTVFECANLYDAVKIAEQERELDLIVLDLRMPGMNGTEGVEVFRRKCPNLPVLIMSGYYRRQDVVDSLQRGAVGFMPKTLGSEAMLNALRLIMSGEKFIPSDLLPDANGESADTAEGGGALKLLTERERDVLGKLVEGLPNKAIARELHIQEVTVKLHLRNIYRKLGATNRAHAVKIAFGMGWEI